MNNELLKSESDKSGLWLDPRTKLFLMLVVNISVFKGGAVVIMAVMSAIPISLLMFSGRVKGGIICALLYIVAAFTNYYLVHITHGFLNVIIVMLSGMLYRMMPAFIMGYYLVATTTVSEFIASMERMRVPKQIVIPVSVMFRFFPTVKEEAESISDAMSMRGIKGIGSLKNPMAALEYRLVPLLMCSVKIGDELSAASLTRGLDNPIKRTNICKVGFGVCDALYAITGIVAFIIFLI
jgi:energy-coupling factor transport system permease protein